jgi:Flp pilus assembly pilin Flp
MIDTRSFLFGASCAVLVELGLLVCLVMWDLVAGALKSSWTPISNFLTRRNQ